MGVSEMGVQDIGCQVFSVIRRKKNIIGDIYCECEMGV